MPRRRLVPVVLVSLALVVVVLLTSSHAANAHEVPAPGEDDGMALLRRAARSMGDVSFSGVQRVTTAGGGTRTERLVSVVHRAGEATVYGEIGPPGADLVVGQSTPLTKVDDLMLDELAANYRVTRAGGAVVCGRTATVLEVLRADGTAAARVWLDQRTGLPLRKVVLDDSGAVVHAMEFVEVQIGGDPGPLPEDGVEAEPWDDELSQGELAALREDGWPLPGHVAWNLRLIRGWSREDPEGRVVHLAYSDGLSVVSVFVQRGRLPGGAEGRAEAAADVVAGGGAEGGQRVWDSHGFVYTAMGDAPADLLAAAERGFPTDDEPEFWSRVMRGFGRLTAAVQG
ncbi:hypothetical protein LG943_01445 [Streptomonospora sp. S1-112]|uniref:MucB/RseB N-terminal domain-containing protein n=1 Tax=Streptomonospora mangrovi TaxID=2883123 RepID=A0A9X3SKN4_9ACTN|nr:sigma-E factor regulatory protein RseB domain-containing protein [Streptomonospora mangrovi]MDA0563006.1 hypothetical protein [Streptomonospora mangrovi]